MQNADSINAEAEVLLASRVAELRRLSYAEAVALPEAVGEELSVAGRVCALTIFRQVLPPQQCLLVAQLAFPSFLGIASSHRESGLIFEVDGSVREATHSELQNTGG